MFNKYIVYLNDSEPYTYNIMFTQERNLVLKLLWI